MGNSDVRDIREYNSFIKKYKICKGFLLTIKVNEYFGVDFTYNTTLPPEYRTYPDKIINKDKEIELKLDKSLYPHPKDWTGGDRHRIYGFKATKKGTYKIKFESYTLTVNVV